MFVTGVLFWFPCLVSSDFISAFLVGDIALNRVGAFVLAEDCLDFILPSASRIISRASLN